MIAQPDATELPLQGAYPELDQLIGWHRRCADLKLVRRSRRSAALSGEWQTRRRGRGIDFDEVRPYQAGDDIRSIDWRVTARSQQPHTKVYHEEQERPVLLAADLRSSMFFGSQHCFKSVLCSSLMSALGWIALANRDRVGGLVFGDQQHREIRPKRSKHAALNWVQLLHQFAAELDSPCPTQPSQPLYKMLEKLLPICRPGSGLYIASDFHDLDSRSVKLLYQLSRHADLTLFMLHDPLEQQLPRTQQLWVTDGQQRHFLTGSDNQQDLIEQRLEQLKIHCGQFNMSLVSLSTGQPLQPLLARLYGKRR
ncbi:MAG: DUF58 domain-containing protein [Motiliproteus sp.]